MDSRYQIIRIKHRCYGLYISNTENFKKITADLSHLYTLISGSWFPIVLVSCDKIYQGKYSEAANTGMTAAITSSIPYILKFTHPVFGLVYTASVTAGAIYHLYDKINTSVFINESMRSYYKEIQLILNEIGAKGDITESYFYPTATNNIDNINTHDIEVN